MGLENEDSMMKGNVIHRNSTAIKVSNALNLFIFKFCVFQWRVPHSTIPLTGCNVHTVFLHSNLPKTLLHCVRVGIQMETELIFGRNYIKIKENWTEKSMRIILRTRLQFRFQLIWNRRKKGIWNFRSFGTCLPYILEPDNGHIKGRQTTRNGAPCCCCNGRVVKGARFRSIKQGVQISLHFCVLIYSFKEFIRRKKCNIKYSFVCMDHLIFFDSSHVNWTF